MDPIKQEDDSGGKRLGFPPYKRDPRHDYQTAMMSLLEHIDEAVSMLADTQIKEKIASDDTAQRNRDRARQGAR
jgi:hypothetical protein